MIITLPHPSGLSPAHTCIAGSQVAAEVKRNAAGQFIGRCPACHGWAYICTTQGGRSLSNSR